MIDRETTNRPMKQYDQSLDRKGGKYEIGPGPGAPNNTNTITKTPNRKLLEARKKKNRTTEESD